MGARLQSELLPVTWDDVALDEARLTITATHAKNSRARHVPLSPDMAHQHEPLVFPAPSGGRLHRFKDQCFVAVAIGCRGTKLGIHSLRHIWASRMIEAGADLTVVQQLGGWSSLQMVARYSHHRPEQWPRATPPVSSSPVSLPRPGDGERRDLADQLGVPVPDC